MTMSTEVLSAFSLAKLFVALWLMSHTLARRGNFAVRLACVGAAALALMIAMPVLGFSVFPAITDDLSFLFAILNFVAVLAVTVLVQRALFSAPLWTSVFCCSTAYLIENLSSSAERTVAILVADVSPLPILREGLSRYVIVSVLSYVLIYLLFVRRFERRGLLAISDPVMVLSAVLTIMVNMVLDLVIKDVATFDIPIRYGLSLSAIHMLICVYVLYSSFEIIYNRRLLVDVATAERLRVTEARQYQMSRENIEAINLKCHDIKHQIRSLRDGGAVVDAAVLDELSRKVNVYDSVVKSGNDALDTILTEKSLVCQQRGITLSCIADGSAVDFVAPTDLYSLFGNALDNAIEASGPIADPECRSISLIVQRVGDMASIHVENLFDGELRLGEDGLPLTSKDDRLNHGFGMRSMRQIVESYGGTFAARTSGDAFMLDMLIPQP